MFFTRRDGGVSRRAARRIRSPRASVYLEFAVVMPIVAMIIAFIFEFISLWDARIMANHTAWVCGRIASVNVANEAYKVSVKKNDLLTDDMKTAAVYLMSTCSMGGTARVGKSSGGGYASVLTVVKNSYSALQECFTVNWKEAIDSFTKHLLNFDGSTDSLIDVIKKAIVTMLNKIIEAILSPLLDIFKELRQATIFNGVDIDKLTGSDGLSSKSFLWQLGDAQKRMDDYGSNIFDIRQRDGNSDKLFFRNDPDESNHYAIDFPRHAMVKHDKEEPMLTSDASWPPNGQCQRMIDVKIYWPFENAWLWQALAPVTTAGGDRESTTHGGTLAARGRALVYPQPIIRNVNLDSENPEGFVADDRDLSDPFANIKAEYNNFLKTVWFWYTYRTYEEYVCGFELENDKSSKALHFISGGHKEWNKLDAARRNWDGIYNWMIGLIDADLESEIKINGVENVLGMDYQHYGTGVRKELGDKFLNDPTYRPESYMTSFREFFRKEDGHTYEATNSVTGETMDNYYKQGSEEPHGARYRGKDWFYWHINHDESEKRIRWSHLSTDELCDYFFKSGMFLPYVYKKVDGKEYETYAAYLFMAWDELEVLNKGDGGFPALHGLNNETTQNIIKGKINELLVCKEFTDWKKVVRNEYDKTVYTLLVGILIPIGTTHVVETYGDFPDEIFTKAAWDYYTNNMRGWYPYVLDGWHFMKRTARDPNSQIKKENEQLQLLSEKVETLTGEYTKNKEQALDYHEKLALDLIKDCREELGKSTGVETGAKSSDIDLDTVLAGDQLNAQELADEYQKDPTKCFAEVEDALKKQKQDVFAALQKVDQAEKELIAYDVEAKFTAMRDKRVDEICSWMAREILTAYCSSIGWNYSYNGKTYVMTDLQQAWAVQQDTFAGEKDSAGLRDALVKDWREKLDAIYQADKELGNLLGLTAAAKTTTVTGAGAKVCPDGTADLKGPSSPDMNWASNGSADDGLGSSWKYDSSKRHWVPDGTKSTW